MLDPLHGIAVPYQPGDPEVLLALQYVMLGPSDRWTALGSLQMVWMLCCAASSC